jgi:RNA polymerase sigma factor (sigma-70 family)
MAGRPFQRVVSFLHRVAGAPDAGVLSDGQLLERYATAADGPALEALIHRHAGLVWGVCRRLLRTEQDAEDAFQAAFLVLVRKAGSLERRPSLAGWLYGVAYRVAQNILKARAVAIRRGAPEVEVADMPQKDVPDESDRHEVQELLDAELHRLPEKYRAPLLLCFMEGKTNEQAAEELGWPTGTVKSRLQRGRGLLHGRLTRRGVALGTALTAPLALPSPVPAALVSRTLQTAVCYSAGQTVAAPVAVLTEGVLRTMFLTKVKVLALTAAACLAAVVGGSVLLAQSKPTPEAPKPQAAEGPQGTKGDLTPESFAKLYALVSPHADEWRHLKVNWLTDVVSARKKAAAEDKPILICYTGGAGYNEPLGVC